MAGDRECGEVALGIALAAQVKVIIPGPKEAAALKVSLTPPDRMPQHMAQNACTRIDEALGEPSEPLGLHENGKVFCLMYLASRSHAVDS